MSLRVALIGGMLILGLVATVGIGLLGVLSIKSSVIREAQQRVNRDLDTVLALYSDELQELADELHHELVGLDPGEKRQQLSAQLVSLRIKLNLSVLNICDPDGMPLAGSYPNYSQQLAISQDPILRRALGGSNAWGMVRLEPDRLEFEGGAALLNQQVVAGPDGEPASLAALMQWFALPLLDDSAGVVALVYGGHSFNHDFNLVSRLHTVVFGDESYEGKPVGTVTFFLGPTRVTTNVLDAEGRRAVGTHVSDEVRREVLERGRRWRSRAWVVDAWYLSAYAPIRNPDGGIIGMAYVGILEAPYNKLRASLIARFLTPVALVLVLGFLATTFIVRQITQPLRELTGRAGAIARGEWPEGSFDSGGYTEIGELNQDFMTMQEAIRTRDEALRGKNADLGEANRRLLEANANYMNTLAFVTHELKSPLAANQSLIDLLVDGQVGDVSESAKQFLVRVKRNSEELQDMVKDYLDLSRAERGELQPEFVPTDLCEDIVQPACERSSDLFQSRGIKLSVDCPKDLRVEADPELLRIALSNYLSNAAKYGRENGAARLEVRVGEKNVEVSVWNEGEGFASEEAATLFGKFNRLKNENTRGKRGSGLGLFLSKQILESHAGEAWAESKQGEWARFGFRLPIPDFEG